MGTSPSLGAPSPTQPMGQPRAPGVLGVGVQPFQRCHPLQGQWDMAVGSGDTPGEGLGAGKWGHQSRARRDLD